MHPASRLFGRLAAIAALLLLLRAALEQATFRIAFNAPPRWRMLSGGSSVSPDGPAILARRYPSVHVRGELVQPVRLWNGARRPVVVQFWYRAPRGAWIGLQGDPTAAPYPELVIRTTPLTKIPKLPDTKGMYRIPLPAAATWTPVEIRAAELTDLPMLTLHLGSGGAPASFAHATFAYQNAPGDNQLDNPDFGEEWPGWAIHPLWLKQDWHPIRTVIVLTAALGGLLTLRLRQGILPKGLGIATWIGCSALILVGVSILSPLGQALFSDPYYSFWLVPWQELVWAAQLATCFVLGRVGGQLFGRRLAIAAIMAPFLAGACMATALLQDPQTGYPILETAWKNVGWTWLLACTVAFGVGIFIGAKQPAPGVVEITPASANRPITRKSRARRQVTAARSSR